MPCHEHTYNKPACNRKAQFSQLPHHLLSEPEPRTDRRLRSMFPYASGSGKTGDLVTHQRDALSGNFRDAGRFLLRLPGRSASFWKQYFDLGTDYGSFIASIRADDAYLAAAADAGSGIRILRQDLWEMMITFLISQQKTIPKIREAVETLAKYGAKRTAALSDGSIRTYYSFPSPEELASASLDDLLAFKTRLPRQIHPPPHPGCPRRNRILRIPRSPAAGRSHDRTYQPLWHRILRSPTASASSDSTTSTPSPSIPGSNRS